MVQKSWPVRVTPARMEQPALITMVEVDLFVFVLLALREQPVKVVHTFPLRLYTNNYAAVIASLPYILTFHTRI